MILMFVFYMLIYSIKIKLNTILKMFTHLFRVTLLFLTGFQEIHVLLANMFLSILSVIRVHQDFCFESLYLFMLCLFAVPGDGGSQLEARLHKPSTVAWYCYKTTDYWFDLWLNLELWLPKAINCLIDNMRYLL